MIKLPPKVMTFSATDPTGGAGLQADLLTLASLGCHPLSITTAITVQDTIGVDTLLSLDADLINNQARSILKDIEVSVFKLGLLGSIENISTVAKIIDDYPGIPLIIDPVLTSGRGDELAGSEVIEAMIQLLLPHATLITPNSLEARRLVAMGKEDIFNLPLKECAARLSNIGCKNILITGAHENNKEVINTYYPSAGEPKIFYWERLLGSYHGSGCTLTSAISAYFAKGLSLEMAIERGQNFTWQALKKAFKLGVGQAIPNRFYWASEER